MKTITLGLLNTLYGVICSLLFLIQTGKIVLWNFVDSYEYTPAFEKMWEIALFVLLLLSIVLLVLNLRRKNKSNKTLFAFLNGLICLNGMGTITFNGVAVFSFVIVLLGILLVIISLNGENDEKISM